MSTQSAINNIGTIAAKEFRDNFKSIRFILIGVLYLILALPITVLVIWAFHDANAGGVLGAMKPGKELLGMLDGLNLLLVLLAIVVTSDTLSLEKRDRTIYQLLSKPIERSSVIIGKFLGCLGIVSTFFIVITVLAYGLTAIITGAYPSVGDLMTALEALAFMILLFSTYVGIGIFISTLTRNPMISIIGGVLVWIALFFMNIFGKAIGGLLMSKESRTIAMLGGDMFSQYPDFVKAIIWSDPISHDIVGVLLNGGTMSMGLSLWANLAIIIAYTVVFLLATIVIFNRQDI